MKRLCLLVIVLLLTGCSAPNSPGDESARVPPSSVQGAAAAERPLQVTLTSSLGLRATVLLVAADEQFSVVKDPWCGGRTGDRIRQGHYAMVLEPEGREAQPQDLTLPFGDEPLTFNEQRPGMLTILPGKVGEQPDLLLIRQYGSCNGDLLGALVLTPDGASLRVLPFRTDEGEEATLFAGVVEPLGPGRLRTEVYNNATGVTRVTTWELREARGAVEEVSTSLATR